jgi:hypothetical protein
MTDTQDQRPITVTLTFQSKHNANLAASALRAYESAIRLSDDDYDALVAIRRQLKEQIKGQ